MLELLTNQNYFLQLLTMIESAESKICIVIYNWHFYNHDPACRTSQLNQAIIKKQKEGVGVFVVVGNSTLQAQLKKLNIKVKYNKLRGLNHAKLVIIDDKICSVGSHNFSENAWSRNEEATVITDQKDFILQCQNYFNNLYSKCI